MQKRCLCCLSAKVKMLRHLIAEERYLVVLRHQKELSE